MRPPRCFNRLTREVSGEPFRTVDSLRLPLPLVSNFRHGLREIPLDGKASRDRLLLAIESSCDETAAAVVDRQRRVLSSVVATQNELHQRFGGVVPEIASRAHVERILPVIDETLRAADVTLRDIGAIAVATNPGLVGSLLVGLTAAKTLALVLDVPLLAVNHIEAHMYACRMVAQRDVFPAVGLVVSGGHTNLYDCRSPVEFELLGSTTDDAAGEAFDKVAQILGLEYPGGPQIEHLAATGNPAAFPFPRTFLNDERLKFSFSGLKTAVLYATRGTPGSRIQTPNLTPQRRADLAASFQAAVIDVLVGKCEQTLRQTGRRTLLVGGGVAANSLFRSRLQDLADRKRIDLVIAPREYCTDNAAMAAIGWELWERGMFSPLDIDVTPGLVRKRNQ
jgi:N6-L-threonylcarbamoyladenine synthase